MPDIGPLSPMANRVPASSSSGSGDGGIGAILRKFDIPWPAANEDSLREAASIWHTLAENIRDNYGQANSAASSLTSNNEGAAIEAFEQYWQKYGGKKGALPLAASACDAMSTACTKYADDVATTKSKIEEAAAEIGAVLVVGTIGAFFTFGATEALADSIAAGVVATASEAITNLGLWVADTIEVYSTTLAEAIDSATIVVADAAGSSLSAGALSSALSGSASAVGGTAFADTADNGIAALLGDKPLSSSEAAESLIDSAGEGTIGGVLGKLGELGAPQLARLVSNAATSVSESDPQLFMQLMATSKALEGVTGKVAVGTLSSIASQLIVTQQIDAAGVSSDQLTDMLKRAAEGGEE
ncbi:MAG TPA: hypothetical protein VGG75_07630 [Trebonia sp.]|jgi:hypothetical protein